ncbi:MULTISPECIES: pantetheine-phosphate adenylyltransferase [unclassified Curtobacterium]|jgi:pantetheine-phosphate adenylyltransferase|uniref:pantetheine-phosphate adenylyltransferase n=1 Tax=unclassified Curtobacterium TaxID=257496 RepID=UPI00052A9B0C|nr:MULTISPECIES: pantetheine-phosphate adenylyltransferase [unclassified Curtobacterium]AIV40396.1 phosphopantetheine adenylyltransferase [Curtobacterium sp. MR_MD2014]MBP1300009.1 pantetheine-phosphate adenylyltransferase [Curtobacterium sp. 1310]MCM3505441.1 pantetheine-phosphate adenylyltransferase [Curtobacterium sp. ODYSSEY 48 V2]MCM3520398.1 pantetheine-phosphate adenylyltransferase [Curtobacterium sp. P97]MDB6426588.1 pantetheine-phosphate adenylyltransferase [Curtobacterium sp. 20TX000
MAQIAVVPGSFDPVTLGHLDVIGRAARLFDEVHVLVVHNPDKQPAMFAAADRVRLIEQSLVETGAPDSVRVGEWTSGLLVDYCRQVGAGVLVKGVRSGEDVAYETPMAIMNRHLADVETVFLLPEASRAHVSSSLIRQVATLGGDVTPYVPVVVADALAEHLGR